MKTINQRLQFLVDELAHGNGAFFCQQTGIGYMTFKNYIGGRFSKPSSDTLESIAITYPQVSLRWLLTGEGEPFEQKEKKKTPTDEGGDLLSAALEEIGRLKKQVSEFEAMREQLNLIISMQHALGPERDQLRGRLKKSSGAPNLGRGFGRGTGLTLF